MNRNRWILFAVSAAAALAVAGVLCGCETLEQVEWEKVEWEKVKDPLFSVLNTFF